MIKSFKSNKLKKFWEKDKHSLLPPSQIEKILQILNILASAQTIQDCDAPGMGLHSFNERKPKVWSLAVNGNYRILFEFENNNVYNIDYADTH